MPEWQNPVQCVRLETGWASALAGSKGLSLKKGFENPASGVFLILKLFPGKIIKYSEPANCN